MAKLGFLARLVRKSDARSTAKAVASSPADDSVGGRADASDAQPSASTLASPRADADDASKWAAAMAACFAPGRLGDLGPLPDIAPPESLRPLHEALSAHHGSVRAAVDDIDQIVGEAKSLGDDMVENNKTISRQAVLQIDSVQALSFSFGAFSDFAQRIGAASSETEVVAATTGSVSEQMIGGIEQITAAIHQVSAVLDDITAAAASIEDMAFQSHILAINSSVEAARAGEHGKSFTVIAAEMRVQADTAKQCAVQIGSLASDTSEAISLGVSVAKSTQEMVAEIRGASTALNRQIEAMQIIAREQQEKAASLIEAVERTTNMSVEAAKVANETCADSVAQNEVLARYERRPNGASAAPVQRRAETPAVETAATSSAIEFF